MSRPDIIPAYRLRGSSICKSSVIVLAQGLGAIVAAAERGLRPGQAEHTGTDGVPLGVVGIEKALRRCAA